MNALNDTERKESVNLEGTIQPAEKMYTNQELAEKIYHNSHFPTFQSNVFRIHDKNESEQVTAAGREAVRELTRNISEIWY